MYRCHRQQQDSRHSGKGMAGTAGGWMHTPLADDKPRRRHGDRPWRICCVNIQARHQVHQHPHHPARNGRCIGGRKDGHKLRRTEKRDWRVQQCRLCDSRHRVSKDHGQRQHLFGLRRDAETRADKQRRDVGGAAELRHTQSRPAPARQNGERLCGGEAAHCAGGPAGARHTQGA